MQVNLTASQLHLIRVNSVSLKFRILQMVEGGLNDYWYRRNSPISSIKSICQDSRRIGVITSLSLRDLASVFLLPAFGLGLASVAFLLELACYSITAKRFQNKPPT